AIGRGGQQLGDRNMKTVAFGVGVDRRRRLRLTRCEARDQACELDHRGRRRVGPSEWPAQELLECLPEGPERNPNHRVAAAAQDGVPSATDLRRQLAYEAALARARLAGDQRD